MIRIMVVDDEYFVRRGIIDSIDWGRYGVAICGEAESGEEALELLAQAAPDIILTDIKMGGMDGIELIAQASARNEQVRFIILSGHGEFAYAQQAMGYGVSQYLLKPIGAEELVRAVLKAKEELRQQDQELPSEEEIKQNLLLPWNMHNADVSLHHSRFRVLAFSIVNSDEAGRYAGNRADAQAGVLQLAREYFNLARLNHIATIRHGFFVITWNYEENPPNLLEFLACFAQFIQEKTGYVIDIGVGREYVGYRGINRSYTEALFSFAFRFDRERARVLPFEHLPQGLPWRIDSTDLLRYKNEETALLGKLTGDPKGAEAADLWKAMTEAKESLALTQGLFLKAAIVYADSIRDISRLSDSDRDRMNQLFTSAYSADQPWKLPDFLNLTRTVGQVIKKESASRQNDMIGRAVRYLEKHYAESVTLADVAEEIKVSPNYLSKIFKEVMGKSFVEYLTEIRIAQAKYLLAGSDLKISRVAEQVGYSDYKYFTQIFRKLEGQAPSEYRKN